MSDPTRDNQPGDDRLERLLLDAGFDVDPDAALAGRAAAERDASTDGELPDPWAALAPVTVLDDEQRAWLDTVSPALGAALPGSSLTGDDPFGGIGDDDLARADDEIIDLD